MPKSYELSPPKKRRSSRLMDRQAAASNALSTAQAESISAPPKKRRKFSDGDTLSHQRRIRRSEGASSIVPTASGSDSRRFQRITIAELERREKRLLQKEQDLKTRSDNLEERMSSLIRKEGVMMSQLEELADREIQSTLKHLEDHFTCSLCYEILAAPYSLNPSPCGHTFCGLCILKWFFSRLHRACGGWHESVDCPICRSLLIITPEHTPRLQLTFPFVPNRITASVIEFLVEKLVNPPLCAQAKIKKEEGESTWTSQSKKKERGGGCVRKRETSEEREPAQIPETPDISAWREGGHMRAEWLKKDREGKEKMAHILKYWSTMESQDFIDMKQTLGV